MAKDMLKVMLSVLQEISEGNPFPKASDYDIDINPYANLLESMQNEGYIRGLIVQRGGQGNKPLAVINSNVAITIKGLEYISANSKMMKMYKGLKEVRDWMPF